MDNRKSLILIKIKTQIDIQMRADYDSYWQNQTKKLLEKYTILKEKVQMIRVL